MLRHDLDMSIEAALQVARVEHAIGMKATYFVLLRTEFYNPFSEIARETLFEIMNLGHRIGLHFDASLYQDGGGDFENVVDWECETLSRLLRREVDIVSFHRPAEKPQPVHTDCWQNSYIPDGVFLRHRILFRFERRLALWPSP